MVFSLCWSVAQQSEIPSLLGAPGPTGSNRTPTPTGVTLCGGGGWGGVAGDPPKHPLTSEKSAPARSRFTDLDRGVLGLRATAQQAQLHIGSELGLHTWFEVCWGPERQPYKQGCIPCHGWGHRLGPACVGNPDQQPCECICISGLGWGHRRGHGG